MDEPHVPDVPPEMLAEVEWRWEALCRDNPRYFDGRLYHVFGVHRNGYGGAVIHVADCAYRYHAVQNEEFDLGVRPLGTKGLIQSDDRFLLGKRSMTVNSYQGVWEFAPAGVVEPGQQPVDTILAELREETGLAAASEPTPIAVLHDSVLRCWEILFRITPVPAPGNGDSEEPHARVQDAPFSGAGASAITDEYDELRWCLLDNLPEKLTPTALQVIPLI